MSRLMSRFAMPRSEESRMESLADPSRMGDVDENDPKSVARMMKRMGKEMGDEFSGPEFDEAVEEIERAVIWGMRGRARMMCSQGCFRRAEIPARILTPTDRAEVCGLYREQTGG